MNIHALRQRKADLVKESAGIFEAAKGRAMTAEEKARDDAIEAELTEVNDAIARAERQMAREAALTGTALTPAPVPAAAVSGDPLSAFPEARRSLLSAHGNMPNAVREQLVGYAGTPFTSLGEQMQAVYRAAVVHDRDSRLVAAASGANETIPADGGFVVQVDSSTDLLRRTFEKAMLASKVRKFPISASSNGMKINALKDDSRATGSRFGGVQAYWTAEAGTIANGGRPQFRQMELNLKKLAGLCYATDEMLQDAAFLEALLMEAFSDEFAFLVDDAILFGNGSGKPLGFMNGGGKVSVAKETGQAARTIVFENIQKMWARMWSRSMSNSVWYINQDCYPQLNSMTQVVGTGGVPVYLPPGGLSQAPFGTLMGRPVMPIEFCETVGTEGDIILADLGQYMMIDKSIQSASSIHVAFLTGEQAFRFIYRVDGQPVDNKPITPYKGTATQSPFITLATRA